MVKENEYLMEHEGNCDQYNEISRNLYGGMRIIKKHYAEFTDKLMIMQPLISRTLN